MESITNKQILLDNEDTFLANDLGDIINKRNIDS